MEDIDSETMFQVFRAGITTPRAFFSNRVSEIVDVTGLDADVIGRMVSAVRGSDVGKQLIEERRCVREQLSMQQLKDLEVKLTKALRIRETIISKLQKQRRLMEQIQRENAKFEAYFTALSEKLRTLQLAEDEFQSSENSETSDTEIQHLRIRIRSIRRQIEKITHHDEDKANRKNVLLRRVRQLQNRYKNFVAAEEEVISRFELNKEQLSHLKRSITAVKKDLMIQNRQR
jgi:chromosome segregation ATPase